MKTQLDTPALLHSCTTRSLRRLTRTWPGWLPVFALAIGLLAIGRNAQSEEWTFHCEQSLLTVGAAIQNSPSHPQNPFPGQTRVIRVRPELTTWGYNESDLGNVELDVEQSVPAPQADVSISVSSPGIAWSQIGTGMDGSGYTYWDYELIFDDSFISPIPLSVTVNLSFDNVGTNVTVTASSDFMFTPAVAENETWTKQADQATLITSLPGGISELNAGATYEIPIHAEIQTWEVWCSDYDRTEFRNQQSSPASGAALSVWLPAMSGMYPNGVGSLSNVPAQLDEEGNAIAPFTLGPEGKACQVNFYISYAGYGSFANPIFKEPLSEETWTFTRNEGGISVALTSDGALTSVQQNETRNITSTVTYTSWELWTSSHGRTQTRNQSTAPAVGAITTWSIPVGSGSLTNASPATDSGGISTVSYVMGGEDSQVSVDVNFLGCANITARLNFSLPTGGDWQFDHQDGFLSVTLNGSTSDTTVALTGLVSYETWDVYRHTGTGARENRNHASGTAEGAQLTWGISGFGATAMGDTASNIVGNFAGTASLAATSVNGTSVMWVAPATVMVNASFSGMVANTSISVGGYNIGSTNGNGGETNGGETNGGETNGGETNGGSSSGSEGTDGDDASVYVVEQIDPLLWVEGESYVVWSKPMVLKILEIELIKQDGTTYGVRLVLRRGVRVHPVSGIATLVWSDGSTTTLPVSNSYTDMVPEEDLEIQYSWKD